MRVLIIGGGGREHALAWKLLQEDPSLELIAAPGNPGIAALGECVPIATSDIAGLARLAADRRVDLTVVGPEAPLEAGIVDRFRADGLPVFGPTRAAAEIETSKAFAKQLMLEDGIPTARAEVHSDSALAKACARRFGAPVVVKASGLAAGKGVIVCQTLDDADRAIDDMLELNRFGAAGAQVLVEEFMEGEEVSIFAITDGHSFVVLPALQDHKRLLDDDRGPNTGGMGAYLPVSLPIADRSASIVSGHSLSLVETASQTIFAPTLRGLAKRGRPFSGLLYAGLMITRTGPKVVEFNCRFGDPETEALMPVLRSRPGLLGLMMAAAAGRLPGGRPVESSGDSDKPNGSGADTDLSVSVTLHGTCVTTILAAANYPGSSRTGDVITLPSAIPDGIHLFHAGTARDAQGRLVTAGGRVLAVSAVGATVDEARERSQAFAAQIEFAGKQYRTDIGWREIDRQKQRSSARAPRD
jgi:phosphoribosylamine--glycine ligase